MVFDDMWLPVTVMLSSSEDPHGNIHNLWQDCRDPNAL